MTTFKLIYIPNGEYLKLNDTRGIAQFHRNTISPSDVINILNKPRNPMETTEIARFKALNNLPVHHILTEEEFEAVYDTEEV